MQGIKVLACIFFFSLLAKAGFSFANDPPEDLPEEQTQVTDTVSADSINLKIVHWYYKDQIISPFKNHANYIDTNLLAFQQYDYAFNESIFLAQKGNVGHASKNLVFSPWENEHFLLYRHDLYPGYKITNEDIIYVRPEHVFSELFYVLGSNREQLFYAKHSQKLDTNLYIGFSYKVINSPGEYSRMGARNTNLNAAIDYTSKNERYQMIGTAAYNKIMNHESGGIKNPESFAQNEAKDSVFLYQALSRNFDLDFHLNHFYRFGFDYNVKSENNSEDSIETIKEKRHFNLGRLGHEFKYRRQSFVFEDNSAVYPFFDFEPYDNSSTYDSTVVSVFQNELSWSNYPISDRSLTSSFYFKVFLKHQQLNLKFPDLSDQRFDDDNEDEEADEDEDEDEEEVYYFDERIYDQLIPGVEFHTDDSKWLSFFGNANTIIGGYNDNDYSINAGFNIGKITGENTPGKSHYASFNAGVSNKEVPYFMNYYVGNYFRWGNKFSKMKMTNLSAKYSYSGISIEGNYYKVNNIVFMNENIEPEQNESSINTFTLGLKTDHNFWGLGIRNSIVYQYIPDNSFEDYPELLSYHSLYYGNSLFKNALLFQIGLDLSYNSPYKPAAYMPAVLQFYQQTEYNTDHMFLLDAFLNVKISDVRVFVKYQNFGGLLMQDWPLYQIPYYPIPEGAFKFGISWMFFN
ncbi:MAG: putative porin [Bacteroidota bacterium]